MKAADRRAVDGIIAQGPFFRNRIAEYRIVEFTPALRCDELVESISG